MSAESSGEGSLWEQGAKGQGSKAVVLDLSSERHNEAKLLVRGQSFRRLGSFLFWQFSLPRPADAFGAAGDFCIRPQMHQFSGVARCGTAVTSSLHESK